MIGFAFVAGAICGFIAFGVFATGGRSADRKSDLAFEFSLLRSIARATAEIEDELSRIRGGHLVGEELSAGSYVEQVRERRMLLNTWRRRFAAPRQAA